MNSLPTVLPTISNACYFFQILSIVFPFLCVLSCCAKAPTRGLAWCCVAGLTIYEIILFLLGTSLGNLGFLSPSYYRAFFCLIALTLGVISIRNFPALFSTLRAIRYRPAWIDILLIACAWNTIRLIDISFVSDWSTGTASFDSLNYHIPRALVWSWQGSFEPTAANIWQQLGHPYGGAGTILPITFLGCGWLGGSYVTLVLSLGAMFAVFSTCRSFGFSARASLVSAMLFLSCPTVGWRLVDTSTDIAATFPVLAAVALIRSPLSLQQSLFLFPLLVGFGTSIKQYVVFPAIPLALAFFGPHIKEILTSRKQILAGLAGVAAGGIFAFLSLFPIYRVFGNILGDALPVNLSNVGAGWKGIRDSLVLAVAEWTLDPLRFLPLKAREGIFEGFNLSKLFEYIGLSGFNGPLRNPDKEGCRAGLLSLLLLPWLVSAFDGWKQKLFATIAFATIFVSQFSMLSINSVGARFAIIPLAAFCALFAARATKSPVTTCLILLLASYQSVRYVPGIGYLQGGRPRFNPYHEQNRYLYQDVKDDPILLVGRPLSQDAKISGLLGQIRFTYLRCAPENDWKTYLSDAKSSSKWILFGTAEQAFIVGPMFRTTMGPPCPAITLAEFRNVLQASGWAFHKSFESLELWSHL